MNSTKLKIRLTFTSSVLGGLPGNRTLLEDYIASKAPTAENAIQEIESVPDMLEKGTTVFPRDEKGIFLWNYQIKGAIKEVVGILVDLGDIKGITKWTYKRTVDNLVFVEPRKLYFYDESIGVLQKHDGVLQKHDEICERPLRCETMQGDRIAIARSEQVNEGRYLEFEVEVLKSENEKSRSVALTVEKILEAMDFWKRKGIGQWRNSGRGTATVEVLK